MSVVVTTRGLSGLTNLGNTCYMNAAIQAISATDMLLAYLIHPQSNVKEDLKMKIINGIKNQEGNERASNLIDISEKDILKRIRNTITYRLRILYKYMWSENCEVTPGTLKKCINKQLDFFSGIYQHDSQEFLTALIDTIHEETKSKCKIDYCSPPQYQELEKSIEKNYILLSEEMKKKQQNKELLTELISNINNLKKSDKKGFLLIESIKAWKSLLEPSYSVINKIFSGLTLTTIKCAKCDNENYKFERFDLISLSVPNNYQMEEISIDTLFENYVAKECLDGKNQYMCMTCNEKTNASKNQIIYDQPEKLVLLIKKYFNIGPQMIKNNKSIKYKHELNITPYCSEYANISMYELYAAIKHSGGYGSGHYYTYAKSPINNKWYRFDDGSVYYVDDDDEVLKSNSYILFYQKKKHHKSETSLLENHD